MFTKRTIRTSALAGTIALFAALSPLALADEGLEMLEPNTGNISFSGGVDFTTQYFFRGIWQEDQGLIAQPWSELGISLYEGDGFFNSFGLTFGVWASLHDGPTGTGDKVSRPEGASGDPQIFYEFDVYGGVYFGFLENWTSSVTWTAYTSPNDRFNTIQDITFSLGYDDTGLWEDLGFEGFALAPYISFIVEHDDQADAGNSLFGNSGSDEGVAFEFGVEPSFTIIESESYPITLSIPMTLGLGVDDYYEQDTTGPLGVADGIIDDDDDFGYFDVGLVLSMPISAIPSELGAWEISAGVHFLFLGDTNEFANGGDEFETIGVLGLSMAY